MTPTQPTALEAGLIRNAPSPEGYALGEHLARFADAELAKLKERYPNHVEPCATCAFRKGTFANGCAATLMDALKCVMEHDEFHCHEKQNEGRVCAGWFALVGAGSDKPVKAPWDRIGGYDQADITALEARKQSE